MTAALVPMGQRHATLDAHRVGSRIWQGSIPPFKGLHEAGFSMVVLCAEEHQPSRVSFERAVEMVRAPNKDDGSPLTDRQWRLALQASAKVVDHWKRGGRILITCMQGRNRSGLVSALALRDLSVVPMETIIRTIKAARENALTNAYFTDRLLATDVYTRAPLAQRALEMSP